MNNIYSSLVILFTVFTSKAWCFSKGDLSHFIFNNGAYILNAKDAGTSQLFDVFSSSDTLVWQIALELQFSLSTNNAAKIFLWSSDSILNKSENGIYAKIGKSGNDDALEFYQEEHGQPKLLFELGAGYFSLNSNRVLLGVSKLHDQWEVFVELADTVLRKQFTYNLSLDHFYSGLYFNYTKSNTQNIVVSRYEVRNNYSGVLTSLEFLNYHRMDRSLRFQFAGNFGFSDSTSIHLFPTLPLDSFALDEGIITVFLKSNLPYNDPIKCELELFKSGVLLAKQSVQFEVQLANTNELLISEIMTNPIGLGSQLQEGQYLELKNISNRSLSLQGMYLRVKDANIEMPNAEVLPNEYVLLCPHEFISAHYKNQVLVPQWKDFLYSEGSVQLLNQNEEVINTFEYNRKNFPKDYRESGGWSFELANQFPACNSNISYSESKIGGTPGFENSFLASQENSLAIKEVVYLDSLSIEIIFNQAIDLLTPADLNSDLAIENVVRQSGNEKGFVIRFSQPMSKKHLYKLKFRKFLPFCGTALNEIQVEEVFFGIPDANSVNELRFNEIQFNPVEGFDVFIELINTSSNVISLKDIYLADVRENSIVDLFEVATKNLLIAPGAYFVVRPRSSLKLNSQMSDTVYQNIEMQKFPSLPNSSGELALLDRNLNEVEKMTYSDQWHSSKLSETKGVSLERISWKTSALLKSNWMSSSADVGFSTPGKINSASVLDSSSKEGFSLSAEVYFKNKDQEVVLSYLLTEEGYVANVRLFSKDGVVQSELMKEQLLGKHGSLVLLTESNAWPFSPGIYVLLIEALHSTAPAITEKRVITIL